MSEQIQKAFGEHQQEIRRRAAVHSEGNVNSCMFERVDDDGLDDPLENPEQTFVVFSLSHREFAPRASDPTNPGLCVYGAFETREEAMEHAAEVQRRHPKHSLLIDRTHQWICAPATVAHLQDEAHICAKRDALLRAHANEQAAARREFDANVAEQRAGRVAHPAAEDGGGGGDGDGGGGGGDGDGDGGAAAPKDPAVRVHRACRVDGQALAVLSVLPDSDEDAEFLFRVYGLFESEAAANKYVRNVCGVHVQDHNIDVVKTCAWIFPQQMDGRHVQKEVYRSEELNRVMGALKRSPQEVQRFYKEHAPAPAGADA